MPMCECLVTGNLVKKTDFLAPRSRLNLLEQPPLVLVPSRNLVAGPAPGLVGLRSADLNDGGVIPGRPTFDEPLVPARRCSAQHTDGVEFIHDLRNGHEPRHRAKRLAAKVGVGSGHNDATPPSCQGRRDVDHAIVQKLRLIDRDDLGHRINALRNLRRRVDGHGFHGSTVVARDRVDASVSPVEM